MISVIIPTYKEPEYLDLCLDSLFKTQTLNNQVIVVVDGFYELNKPILDKYEGKINILDLQHNQGLSVATNWGVYNSQYEDILIVNDDNVFGPDWDTGLLSKAQEGWVWAPNQIEPNPSMFNQFIIKNFGKNPQEFDFPKFSSYIKEINKDKVDFKGSTLPIFMKKKDFLTIGGWDVMYPSPHVVDWDFFLKCNIAGFNMVRTYLVNFYHFAGAATKQTPQQAKESRDKEILAYEFAKHKWGTNIKHNPDNNLKYLYENR